MYALHVYPAIVAGKALTERYQAFVKIPCFKKSCAVERSCLAARTCAVRSVLWKNPGFTGYDGVAIDRSLLTPKTSRG